MCAECDREDAHVAALPFDASEDADTNQYRGIVISHAMEIVIHELRISGSEMARRMETSPNMISRFRSGRPRRRLSFKATLHALEGIRARGRGAIVTLAIGTRHEANV